MKKVTLSLDSSLKEIFTYEESRAVFDKFLPGMRTMAENQPATLGFSVRKIIQFSGGAIPDEAADALDAALCALELYSAEPEMSDTPLTPDGAEVVPEPPRDAIYPGKVWRDTNGRRIQPTAARCIMTTASTTGMAKTRITPTANARSGHGECAPTDPPTCVTGKIWVCSSSPT